VFAGGGLAILTLLALWLLKPWQRESDSQLRLFNRFERLLARHGLNRQQGEGAQAFSRRAELQFPNHAQAIQAFADEFEALRYGASAGSTSQLRRHLKHLRRSLPWRLAAARGKGPTHG
jgi:hypothetical protein